MEQPTSNLLSQTINPLQNIKEDMLRETLKINEQSAKTYREG